MLLIHYNESVQLTKVALYKYMCSASRISVFSCLWYRWYKIGIFGRQMSSENANSSDSACDDDSDDDNGNSSDGKGFLMILTFSDA
jgi:hypothetical protein